MKNYRIISAPNMLKGISILGWMVIAGCTLILFDVSLIFSNVIIALVITIPSALILYIIINIKSRINPDFIMIKIIRLTKIKKTINAGDFKGNCYVA